MEQNTKVTKCMDEVSEILANYPINVAIDAMYNLATLGIGAEREVFTVSRNVSRVSMEIVCGAGIYSNAGDDGKKWFRYETKNN